MMTSAAPEASAADAAPHQENESPALTLKTAVAEAAPADAAAATMSSTDADAVAVPLRALVDAPAAPATVSSLSATRAPQDAAVATTARDGGTAPQPDRGDDGTGPSLKTLYRRAVQTYTDLVDGDLASSDERYQSRLDRAVDDLLTCANRITLLGLFSTNESMEDVNTTDLQYFAVDFFLGALIALRATRDREASLQRLAACERRFLAFLERCDHYDQLDAATRGVFKAFQRNTPLPREDPGAARESRIARYKAEKAARALLRQLTQQMRSHRAIRASNAAADRDDAPHATAFGRDADDDEDFDRADETLQRQLLMTSLALHIRTALEQLQAVRDERGMLEQMARREAERPARAVVAAPQRGTDAEDTRIEARGRADQWSRFNTAPLMAKNGKILRPFVLSNERQEVRDRVFRPGHNLPTMTVEEYLENEKARGNFLQGGTNPAPKEIDDLDYDALDADTLKKRAFDDFKDANPRGWGNRANKG